MIVSVKLLIWCIWIVDVVTNFDAAKIFIRIFKLSQYLFSIVFVAFLFYSFRTGYLSNIANGYFSNSIFPALINIETPVNKQFPILVEKIPVPYVSAKAVVIVDRLNSKVLYESSSKQKYAPASTTKLMTALVALDLYKTTDVLTVPKICTLFNSTKAGLPEGGEFVVKDLIYSMLIGSAGDCACVLATGKISYEEFVAMMNRKALLLGLTSTHFSNPIGLDDLDGQNYSTAWDLYKLSSFAVSNQLISDAVRTKNYQINGAEGNFAANIYTTNQLLLEIPNTLGIKTGTTQGAGEVFIYEYADDMKELIIVVMGSQDRFTDTKNLLSWAEKSYVWK